jgi:glycosyltransferase involved in cell wall biosynthesis
MDKVSVIVPTYNRFKYLLNTIKSIKSQTYKNIEIIVVNDCSTEPAYYNHDWKREGIIIRHLLENTKKTFGYACAGFVRNKGIEMSSGKYIAVCDDDDIWFPNKIKLQLKAMKLSGCKMSSTDGLKGIGIYNPKKTYQEYLSSTYDRIHEIYETEGSKLLDKGYPNIWDLKFLKIHNCVICSSVLIEREILTKIGNFQHMRPPGEDYDCWLRALQHTHSVLVRDMCFYYDEGHGDGQNW